MKNRPLCLLNCEGGDNCPPPWHFLHSCPHPIPGGRFVHCQIFSWNTSAKNLDTCLRTITWGEGVECLCRWVHFLQVKNGSNMSHGILATVAREPHPTNAKTTFWPLGVQAGRDPLPHLNPQLPTLYAYWCGRHIWQTQQQLLLSYPSCGGMGHTGTRNSYFNTLDFMKENVEFSYRIHTVKAYILFLIQLGD
jgi:hypothetical protein